MKIGKRVSIETNEVFSIMHISFHESKVLAKSAVVYCTLLSSYFFISGQEIYLEQESLDDPL